MPVSPLASPRAPALRRYAQTRGAGDSLRGRGQSDFAPNCPAALRPACEKVASKQRPLSLRSCAWSGRAKGAVGGWSAEPLALRLAFVVLPVRTLNVARP